MPDPKNKQEQKKISDAQKILADERKKREDACAKELHETTEAILKKHNCVMQMELYAVGSKNSWCQRVISN